MVKYQHCYATRRNDVGKKATQSRLCLKPNAELQPQIQTKVPVYYKEERKKMLFELEYHNIIGSATSDKSIHCSTFLNPLTIILKGDTSKIVLDARHLNSNTDQAFGSWPIEPSASQLERAKKFKSALTLCMICTCSLDEETFILTSFSQVRRRNTSSHKFLRWR